MSRDGDSALIDPDVAAAAREALSAAADDLSDDQGEALATALDLLDRSQETLREWACDWCDERKSSVWRVDTGEGLCRECALYGERPEPEESDHATIEDFRPTASTGAPEDV